MSLPASMCLPITLNRSARAFLVMYPSSPRFIFEEDYRNLFDSAPAMDTTDHCPVANLVIIQSSDYVPCGWLEAFGISAPNVHLHLAKSMLSSNRYAIRMEKFLPQPLDNRSHVLLLLAFVLTQYLCVRVCLREREDTRTGRQGNSSIGSDRLLLRSPN